MAYCSLKYTEAASIYSRGLGMASAYISSLLTDDWERSATPLGWSIFNKINQATLQSYIAMRC